MSGKMSQILNGLQGWRPRKSTDGPLRESAKFRAALLVAAILIAAALGGLRPSLSAYVLVLLVGAFGLALLLQQPELGLVALAAMSFTLPIEFGAGGISITPPALLIPLVFGVWLLDSLRRQSVKLPASRTTLPLVLFVGSGALSLIVGTLFWDPSVPRADDLLLVQLAQWAIYAFSAAIFLVTGALGQDTRWLRYATWIFLGLAGIVVLEIFSPNLHQILGWNDPGRAKSSIFLILIAALTTGQLLFNRRLGRPAKLALAVLWAATAYVVWVLWPSWTSAPIPFTAATLTVVWLWLWRRNRMASIVSILIVVALAVVLFPVVFELSGGQQELEESWGGRLVLYKYVLNLVKNNPIFGLGPAAYRHYGYATPLSGGFGGMFWIRPWVSSHNNYIDIYAQVGLVGLALFLWFLVELGRVGWRLASRSRWDFADGYVHGMLGAFVGSLAAMLLVDWLLPFIYNVGFAGFRTSALAWMFLGGLVALEQSAGRNGAQQPLADGS